MIQQAPARTVVQVDCCYCLTTQDAPEPPCLVDCQKCGRPFRVLLTDRGIPPMGLSKEAAAYFQKYPVKVG